MRKEIIKNELERIFCKKATSTNDVVKVRVKKMNGAQMFLLNNIYFLTGVNDVEVKHSGAGITITISFTDASL